MKLLLALALLAPFSVSAQIGHSGAHNWQVKPSEKGIEFHFGEELVTTYNFGEGVVKPYFYPLIGPTGENITRHYPMKEGVPHEESDHVHHRGLWFGLGKVNGVDFWHEPGSKKEKIVYGIMRHKGMNGVQLKGADQSATIQTRSEWVSSAAPDTILCEDARTIRLAKQEDGSLLIDFDIEILANQGDVEIKDDKEGSLAIRVQPTLRLDPPKKAEGETVNVGTILNSAGQKDKNVWGQRANWVDYSGTDSAGKPIGIAFFYHPTNFRAPSWWHARGYGLFACNPFGESHLSNDKETSKGDYTIKNGESLKIRYRLILHPGTAEAAKLDKAFTAYAAE
jgi:hypothetical protein